MKLLCCDGGGSRRHTSSSTIVKTRFIIAESAKIIYYGQAQQSRQRTSGSQFCSIFAPKISPVPHLPHIYPERFEQKVGFDKVRALTAAKCLCPLGAERVMHAAFSTDLGLVQTRLRQVDELRHICLFSPSAFPTEGYHDLTEPLARVGAGGAWLAEAELLQLRQSLGATGAIIAFLGHQPQSYPALYDLSYGVPACPEVVQRIDGVIDKFGRMKDNASPELAAIRRALAAKQASVAKVVQQVLRQAVSAGLIDPDAQPSMREGRVVLPVAAANKRRLKGIVQDESATGRTVFIEPIEVVEAHNEIRELEHEERREVVRILQLLTDELRPDLPDLQAALNFLGDIDCVRAKALFAIEFDGAMPIVQPTPGTYLRQAKHPVLLRSLRQEGKAVVPLDITLGQQGRMVIISGPNAGGKSVCLKTVGILQYMMQCGFLPSVLENSEMGLYDSIFIDIGDEQSIENDLSTYSSHLLSMKHCLAHAGSRSLVLIDEFGAGTEPTAGGAIAEAILRRLCQQGAYGVITTHYSNLKHMAASTEGLVNGAMLFDNARIEPLFRLELGEPGSSFAFEIARKIGLPEQVIAEAEGTVGADYVTFEKLLREVSRDKRYWERKRDSIRLSNKRTEELEERLERELTSIKEERRRIIAEAKAEAKALLSKSNQQIERTIRTIKEANAERTETKEARQRLQAVGDEVAAAPVDDARIDRKMEQIRRRQERKRQRAEQPQSDRPAAPPRPIGVGDRVRVEGHDLVAEVVSIDGRSATVAFGNLLTSVRIDRLSRAADAPKAHTPIARPQAGLGFDTYRRRLNFRSDIDIRGYRADEAMAAVQNLLDEALMFGIDRVRVLHGKGNGILRQVVRDYLRTAPGVRSYADEHVEQGGAGITVVELG